MLIKKSRYRNSALFALLEDGSEVFAGLRPRAIETASGEIEHEWQAGDRIDHMARNYYNDDRRWWRILDANPELLYAGELFEQDDDELAAQALLIPQSRQK